MVAPTKAAIVEYTATPDGKTLTKYADGSSLGTAPSTYYTPAQVRAGALKHLTEPRATRPSDVVYGSCGRSYLYMFNGNEPSGRGYHYTTGSSSEETGN